MLIFDRLPLLPLPRRHFSGGGPASSEGLVELSAAGRTACGTRPPLRTTPRALPRLAHLAASMAAQPRAPASRVHLLRVIDALSAAPVVDSALPTTPSSPLAEDMYFALGVHASLACAGADPSTSCTTRSRSDAVGRRRASVAASTRLSSTTAAAGPRRWRWPSACPRVRCVDQPPVFDPPAAAAAVPRRRTPAEDEADADAVASALAALYPAAEARVVAAAARPRATLAPQHAARLTRSPPRAPRPPSTCGA